MTKVIRRMLLVEQELPTLPEHMSLPPVFSAVRVARSFVFCVVFCRLWFVLLFFFYWPLCCLPFFDLRLLITPLVSLNYSYILFSIRLTFTVPIFIIHVFISIEDVIVCNRWVTIYTQEHVVLLMSIVSYDIDTGTCCFTDVISELRHRHRNMLFYWCQ
jgi:hypothetical protein